MDVVSDSDAFSRRRAGMVESQLRRRGICDQRVLEAMGRVERHQFIAERYRAQAYEDHPIPIGEDQTISQPFIVARMLEALELKSSDMVLEVGTGSGYQTALLAGLTHFVYSVERHAVLAQAAEAKLAQLGYNNTKISIGDGSLGLVEKAPFDAIVVSAGTPQIPPALTGQLREGGRIIVPVGPSHIQELRLVWKQHGKIEIKRLEGCRFVPLIGEQGYVVQG